MPIASVVLRAPYMCEIPTWTEVFRSHCRIRGEPSGRKYDAPSGAYTHSPTSSDNLNAFDTSCLRVLTQRNRRRAPVYRHAVLLRDSGMPIEKLLTTSYQVRKAKPQ